MKNNLAKLAYICDEVLLMYVKTTDFPLLMIWLSNLFMVCTSRKFEMTKHPVVSEQIVSNPSSNGLIGRISLETLDKRLYPWFEKEFDDYTPNINVTVRLKSFNNTYQVIVFWGTWCSDSQREVPRWAKIMSWLGMDNGFITYYGLDRTMQSIEKFEREFNISHVPTFIIIQEGREIGRIVEAPVQSLEEDLLKILLKQPYRPKYSD